MGIVQHNKNNYATLFDDPELNRKPIMNLIFKGIELPEHHLYLWQKITRLNEFIDKEQKNQKLKYSFLSTLPSKFQQSIAKDIPRTFPTQQFSKNKQNTDALSRILVALSNRFPEIGYVSGMSFYVQRIFQVIGEEQTFWLITWLFLNDRFIYNTTSSPKSLKILFEVVSSIIDAEIPKLSAVLKHINVTVDMFASSWIKTLFSVVCDSKYFYTIFSLALLQGPYVWIAAIISMIKSLQQKILKSNRTIERILQISNGKVFAQNSQIKHHFKEFLENCIQTESRKYIQHITRVTNTIVLQQQVQNHHHEAQP